MDGKRMLDAMSVQASGIVRVVDGQVSLGKAAAVSGRYSCWDGRAEVEADFRHHALMRSADQIRNGQQGSREWSSIRRRGLNWKPKVIRLINIQPTPVVHVSCFAAPNRSDVLDVVRVGLTVEVYVCRFPGFREEWNRN